MSPRLLVAASLVALLAATGVADASIIAYTSPAGTVGNQKYGFTVGMDFVPKFSVDVTALGLFSSTGKGFSGTDHAVLFDGVTHAILATSQFSVSSPGTLAPGTSDFFKALVIPVRLAAGHEYTIAAFMPTDFIANSGISGAPPIESGIADISYVGLGRYATSGGRNTFPTVIDNGPANRYSGPTFAFVKVPEPASTVALGIGLLGLFAFARAGKDASRA